MRDSIEDASRILFDWLAVRDALPPEPCDAVIGFGHFDLAIPRHCAALAHSGAAKRIVFTGGIGAGTADLGQPEADAFLTELQKVDPDLARAAIIENRSTNTGDNIRFTREVLLQQRPLIELGRDIRSVLLVATPCRQRRVWLTWRKVVPAVAAWNAPPPADYESLAALYASKGEDIGRQLVGEFERIRDYPSRGWIADSEIPPDVYNAAGFLTANS